MTTTPRNDAAERLRTYLKTAFSTREFEDGALDEALAAERRATVERIRERLNAIPSDADYQLDLVDAILDEEAAR